MHCIPEEITELTSLKTLRLTNLGLVSLPENISNLKNLDSLIVVHSCLTISNEVEKLRRLTWLKYLDVSDNSFTDEDRETLKSALPNTIIEIRF